MADGKKYKILYVVGYANSYEEACEKCDEFVELPDLDGDEFEIVEIADGNEK